MKYLYTLLIILAGFGIDYCFFQILRMIEKLWNMYLIKTE